MLALLFLPILLFAQTPSSEPQRETKQQKKKASIPAVSSPTSGSTREVAAPGERNAQDWRECSPECSNWALVIVAAITAVIGIKTLRTIKIQTAAAKDSADAAKKSADALMLGERAWVLIERDDIKDKIQDPYLILTGGQLIVEQKVPHCILFLKNFGKTPAKITACRFELETSDNPNVPPNSPVYDNPGTFNPYILPQDGSTPFEARMRPFRTSCGNVRA